MPFGAMTRVTALRPLSGRQLGVGPGFAVGQLSFTSSAGGGGHFRRDAREDRFRSASEEGHFRKQDSLRIAPARVISV